MTLSVHVSEFLSLEILRIMLPALSLPLKLSLLELSRWRSMYNLGLYLFSITVITYLEF